MPYPAVCIANEFLRIAREKGEALTPMKLQKLVYFAHGWSLALTGQPLVSERIEAWQYGPVIPALYQEFKAYGNGPITEQASDLRIGPDGKIRFETFCLDDYASGEDLERARRLIAKVFEVYGPYSAVKLSNATHMEGTPWRQVYRDGSRSLIIPDEVIRPYFEDLARVKQ